MTTPIQVRRTHQSGSLRLVQMVPRASAYEVARIVWYLGGQSGLPLVALETLLRTPGPGRNARTLADCLETDGVFLQAGRTHLAAYLEVRGPAAAVRGVIGELARALAGAEPEPRAVHAAVAHVVSAVGKSDRSLPEQADRALYAAFTGPGSAFGEHPEGTVEELRGTGVGQIAASLSALRTESEVTVVFSDPDAADIWSEAWTPLAASQADVEDQSRPSLVSLSDVEPGIREVRVPLAGLRGAHVVWGFLAEVGAIQDHHGAEVAVHGLGGWWQARWQQLFREELGATYGTRTRVHAFRTGSRMYSLTAVGMTLGAVNREQVVERLREEALRFAADGLSDDEYRDSARQLLRAEALYTDSARAYSGRASQPLLEGLGMGFHRDRHAYLAGDLMPADFRARVQRLVEPSVIVVAEGSEE